MNTTTAAGASPVDCRVRPGDLPTCRDKHGHMAQYPGRIVYVHDNWRLVYVGTIDGRHEFFAEKVARIKLMGPVSFNAAKAALIDHVRYEREECAQIGDGYDYGDRNCGDEIRARGE